LYRLMMYPFNIPILAPLTIPKHIRGIGDGNSGRRRSGDNSSIAQVQEVIDPACHKPSSVGAGYLLDVRSSTDLIPGILKD
jgi:hypothetical protein